MKPDAAARFWADVSPYGKAEREGPLFCAGSVTRPEPQPSVLAIIHHSGAEREGATILKPVREAALTGLRTAAFAAAFPQCAGKGRDFGTACRMSGSRIYFNRTAAKSDC